MTNQLIPRLRFKQFKDQWQYTKINNIAKVIGGGTPSTKETGYWNGSINWYSPDEISNSEKSYAYESKNKITQEGLKNSSAKLHPANSTILFTSRANIGSMSILKKEATTNQGFQSLELNNNIYPYFLYSDKRILKHKAFRVAHGSTFLEISNKELKNININIPTLSEQQQIGTFFAKLDRMIELQIQKVAHLKKFKKGYLQKMFPQTDENVPRLRFNGFHDEWNKKRLSKLASIKTGNKNVEDNVKGGKYAFFDRSTQIKYLNTYDYDGEVIVYAGEGANFLPKYFYGKYSLHQRAYGLYNFNNINPIYLYYFLNTKSNTFVRFSVGTTAKSLRKDTFKHVYVNIPSIQEQNKIGKFFKHLDQSINQQENKLTQLKQFKNGYLQKMFI